MSDSDPVPVNNGRLRTPEKRSLLIRLRQIAVGKGTPPKFSANF